jgi:hypothetical protein
MIPGISSSATPYSVNYDTAGRAVVFNDQFGKLVTQVLDANGNRSKLIWPSGTGASDVNCSGGTGAYECVSFSYDALNRVKEIDDSGSTATPLAKYQWDLLSRLALITYGSK